MPGSKSYNIYIYDNTGNTVLYHNDAADRDTTMWDILALSRNTWGITDVATSIWWTAVNNSTELQYLWINATQHFYDVTVYTYNLKKMVVNWTEYNIPQWQTYTAWTGINISWTTISADTSVVQTTGNMVTSLTWADDSHYPTAKAVSDALGSAWYGDMLKSTYDPNNVWANVYDYNNFINTPTIPNYSAWENIEINNNVISANNLYIIHENDVTVSTTEEYWTDPYNASYYYTNIDISANAWIKWVEWALYTFVVNTTMVVAWDYRNVRVKIWTWSYIPVMWSSAILAWSSYFLKTQTRCFQYSTKYQSWWALHLITDSNTTYSSMTVAEITAWTWTTARLITPARLKTAIQTWDTNVVNDTAYASSWNGVTWVAPSKNAVYDKINAMDTTIGNKANTSDVLTKTNTTSYTPSANYHPATKKYVDDNVKTYNAWTWISILNGLDYSAMQWPCPNGFHVPIDTEWVAVKTVWTTLWGWDTDTTNFGIALKLPKAGYRGGSSSNVNHLNSYGHYWCSSRYDASNAYSLNFGSTTIGTQSAATRASGFSIRWFKDSPVVPTSSWTKLYWTSIEAGGIFWSSSLWLISMSSNWTTWITISDKNLWATQVWNSGDTLSEANCGWYFQRWNNYMFPFTWTLTDTSTTQVDASTYWPWNYYSSSTYIKYSWSWDRSDNWNLRWWVTWAVQLNNAITNTGVLSVNGETGNVSIQWLPSWWTVWQVLQMTANWPAWVTLS